MLWKPFLLFCFNCKAENPQVTMRQNSTMVTVMQQCRKCKGRFWNSQSYMPHGKHPVGNILLSLAVLMGGASVSKVLLLFRHLGLCCYSPRTFFSHQRSFIFPAVIRHWELYRAGLVSKLRDIKDVPYETSRSVYSLLQICYRCAGRAADKLQIICRMSVEYLQNICRASAETICNKSANLQTLCRRNQPIMLNKEPTKCTNQTTFI